jgi:hypothetical protein
LISDVVDKFPLAPESQKWANLILMYPLAVPVGLVYTTCFGTTCIPVKCQTDGVGIANAPANCTVHFHDIVRVADWDGERSIRSRFDPQGDGLYWIGSPFVDAGLYKMSANQSGSLDAAAFADYDDKPSTLDDLWKPIRCLVQKDGQVYVDQVERSRTRKRIRQ